MRIGIITHPLGYNYGGILQNYALQTVLKRMGHEPITLNPDPHRRIHLIDWAIAFPKRFLIKYYLGHRKLRLFTDLYPNYNRRTIMKYLQPFIDSHIDYVNVKDYNSLNNADFDALIAGSDQIWRPHYVHPIEKGFFDFARHWTVKRLSFAASFGTEEWEYSEEQTRTCRELINLFDGVSVRERSGVELCKRYFGVVAQHVLDPTMLLTADDYIPLFQSRTPKSSGTLLNYILDESEEKTKLINKIVCDKGLTPFRINGKPELGYTLKERIQPPMESWLRGFYDAQFVVTDSFHACVFSIIFNKPFIVYANKERGYARFKSLLESFGLEDRIVYTIKDFAMPKHDIDWWHVNRVVREYQQEAFNFLNRYLQ
jgi:hypothetical protein